MTYAPDTIILEIRSSHKTGHDTLPSQDATTHQILDSKLKYRRNAPKTIILKTRSEVYCSIAPQLQHSFSFLNFYIKGSSPWKFACA